MAGDWAEGDLLKVVRCHYFAKGDMNGVHPKVFLKDEDEQLISSTDEISEGSVVMACEPCPSAGARAFVRVIHEDGVWVANSNYVQRVWPTTETIPCITAKQENC